MDFCTRHECFGCISAGVIVVILAGMSAQDNIGALCVYHDSELVSALDWGFVNSIHLKTLLDGISLHGRSIPH